MIKNIIHEQENKNTMALEETILLLTFDNKAPNK